MRSSLRATRGRVLLRSLSRSSPASDRLTRHDALLQRCDNVRRRAHPAEYSTLRLDHREPHLMKFRKVGCAAIAEHDAAKAAIVRLAHGGVDADFGGDAAHQQVL